MRINTQITVALSSSAVNRLSKMTPKRMNRLMLEIAPLVTEGWTAQTVANKLGISQRQACSDILAVKQMWADNYCSEEIEAVRGEAIARADYIWRESISAWNTSKKNGEPVAKYLDSALSAMRDKVKLSGAEIDLKIVQQNVNVSMATVEQVANTFEPMSASDFAQFAAAHADAQLKAAAASKAIMPTKPEPVTVVADDPAESWEKPADEQGQVTAKPARVRHPRG